LSNSLLHQFKEATQPSMITGPLRSAVDKLWEEFWTGGITNPLTVIEQISFLMFARMLDINESREEKKASRTKKEGLAARFPQEQAAPLALRSDP
jgi:type I restriction enzyme M protein